jgi:hypothetical protein
VGTKAEQLWGEIRVPDDMGLECSKYKWRQNQSFVEVRPPSGVVKRLGICWRSSSSAASEVSRSGRSRWRREASRFDSASSGIGCSAAGQGSHAAPTLPTCGHRSRSDPHPLRSRGAFQAGKGEDAG